MLAHFVVTASSFRQKRYRSCHSVKVIARIKLRVEALLDLHGKGNVDILVDASSLTLPSRRAHPISIISVLLSHANSIAHLANPDTYPSSLDISEGTV